MDRISPSHQDNGHQYGFLFIFISAWQMWWHIPEAYMQRKF